MKKIVLIISIVSVMVLSACKFNSNVDNNNKVQGDVTFQQPNEEINNDTNKEDDVIVVDEKDEIMDLLIRNKSWPAKEVTRNNGEVIGLTGYFGSGILQSNEGFVFAEDGTFTCFVGIWGESDADFKGTYEINTKNREISLKYNSGRERIAKYRLNENNEILDITEEREDYDGTKVNIIFMPADETREF